MPIILAKDTLTFEPTVVVRSEKGIVHFRGTEQELIDLIKATHNMAEAIRLDLDQEDGIKDNDVFDYEQYHNFATKYA